MAKGRGIPINEPPEVPEVRLDFSIVGKVYGLVEIIRPDRRVRAANQHFVCFRCTQCKFEGWVNLYNLTCGASEGCYACKVKVKTIPRYLTAIVWAAKDRCENPENPAYVNYGGRGIRFEFRSTTEAIKWILGNIGNRAFKRTNPRSY